MFVDAEDIGMLFIMMLGLFVYVCIGAFFAWVIGMDEVSLAYIGVLFFWPMIGLAAFFVMIAAYMIAMMIIGGVVAIFKS